MDLREYITTLRKQWYLIAILAFLGAGGGVYVAQTTPPTYSASTKVFVSPSQGSTIQELVQGSTYTQNLVQSYAELARMPVVLDPVIDELGLDITARELARTVTADTPLDTVIIELSATAGEAERAADIANAVAHQLSRTITELSSTSSPSPGDGEPGGAVQVEVVESAPVPQYPIAPRKKFLVAIGLLGGLVLGVVLAVVRRLLDTRIRAAEDITSMTDVALLGRIPRLESRRRRGVAAGSAVASEGYRRLQTNLQFLDASERLRSFVVTSSVSGEGKSTTSANLALAIAEKGLRVLLIDADLRRPAIADYCGLEGAAGLTTVLIGRARIDEVVQKWALPTLDVLTTGEIPPNPSQLVGSSAMAALLDEAREEYDLVMLDAPPLLPVADATVLARLTDGALVVAGCHKLHRHHLSAALASLETVGARCLGVVANRTGRTSHDAYYGRDRQGPFGRPSSITSFRTVKQREESLARVPVGQR